MSVLFASQYLLIAYIPLCLCITVGKLVLPPLNHSAGKSDNFIAGECQLHALLVYLNVYKNNSVRFFVYLFEIRSKTTAQGAIKLSGIINWGSRCVLHGLKLLVLQLLKR